MVGHLGELGVQFTQLHAWHFCAYGIVGAAVFGRSVGLQVPGVELTGPSAQHEEDAGFFRRYGIARGIGLVFAHDQARNTQVQCAEAAGL